VAAFNRELNMKSKTWFGFVCGVIAALLFTMYQQDRHGGLEGYVAYLQCHWNEYPVWVAYVWLALAAVIAGAIGLIAVAEDT
jgi:CDP-diglyceride synthetase